MMALAQATNKQDVENTTNTELSNDTLMHANYSRLLESTGERNSHC